MRTCHAKATVNRSYIGLLDAVIRQTSVHAIARPSKLNWLCPARSSTGSPSATACTPTLAAKFSEQKSTIAHGLCKLPTLKLKSTQLRRQREFLILIVNLCCTSRASWKFSSGRCVALHRQLQLIQPSLLARN